MNYLTVERVIELNCLALSLIPAKKADSAKVLSAMKIHQVLDACEQDEGDVFNKAAVVLEGLIKAHAFASGNRRTAFLAMKEFLKINNKTTKVNGVPDQAVVLQGIREGYYQHEEIREWIKDGTIRPFKRKA